MSFRFKDGVVLSMIVIGMAAWYAGPAAPKVIEPKPLTETEILQEVQNAHKEKAIRVQVAAARNVFRKNRCGERYSDLTGRTAYEFGISGRLLAAVVFVESSCRPGVVSGHSSVGLMQVNPRVWGHRKDLKDPALNLQIGAQILKNYINRYGVVEGLHHYNGLGNPTNEYAERVLAAGGIRL